LLVSKKLLRIGLPLKIYARLSHEMVQAGAYTLSPHQSPLTIWSIIAGAKQSCRLTFPEGFTTKQIAERLSAKGFDKEHFLASLKDTKWQKKFAFLPEISLQQNLEGFLFPDTYDFSLGKGTEEVIRKMLDNFRQKVVEDLSPELANSNFSLHQTIILASLIEKEAKKDKDRKKIAEILIKRLKAGIKLDVDATICYLTGNWQDPLTRKQLAIDSPYNTRKVRGLPPGPICNPGLDSIKAVLEAGPTPYLYYLTAPDGTTYYAKTLSEHNQNKTKYLKH